MPVSISQRSFTGGCWSPSLDPRTDLAKYATAVKTMRNMYPHVHGGASNRGGTDYVVELKDSTKVGRLVPFQFSTVQSYILDFEDQVIRFVKDGGVITEAAQVISGITQANPAVVTYVGADTYANGDRVIISGVLGMVQVNNREFTVANVNVGANTFELSGINSTAYTAYASGGTASEIYQVTTPYLEADLPLLKFRQSADTIFITHPSYARRKLTRTAHTSWTLSLVTAGSTIAAPTGLATTSAGAISYAVTGKTSAGVESAPSTSVASTNTGTLSWTAATGADSYSVYQSVNGIYQWLGDAVGLSFVLTAALVADVDSSAPQATDPFGSAGNYPGCAAFFKQRLLFARTNNEPQTFWGSRVGDFQNNNISTPVQDDDAYKRSVDSDQVNEIRWMERLRDLIIGTSGGEFKLAPGENTPTSLKLEDQSSWGVSDIQPIKIGTTLLFVDGSNKRVRDLLFSFATDGYEGSDLTILAQHLFETYEISQWCYARQPDSLVWTVRSDGDAPVLAYNKEHQVNGWCVMDTDGTFESAASIQTTDGTNDVYFIVKRTINSVTKRYIEKLHPRTFIDIEDAYFVDCGLTYDGSRAVTLTPGTGALTQGTTAVVFTAGSATFAATDVGRYIHYRYATGALDDNGIPLYLTARALITAYTSTTVVRATIINIFPSLTAIASGAWRMSTTSISGLYHLEGKTLVAFADGNVMTDLLVTGGAITLPAAASKLHIGIAYTSDLYTLGFDYPTQAGSVQDKIKDIASVTVYLRNTRELWIGPDEDHLVEAKFRTDEDYGDPIRLYTGPKIVSIPPGDLTEARVFMQVRSPVPFTIGAVIPQISNGRF